MVDTTWSILDGVHVKAIDGLSVPAKGEQMECGGTPLFDVGTRTTYRCSICGEKVDFKSKTTECKNPNK